ncbi:MAG: asparagine synthase (glutamine-hydrolyzing) [Arenimonas sp. SCN 70-307]|uniref:asparagine synthase (glutamine-hydrolyzing) n=1 Tax=Arenimonas sp. SCN 70-307 TaxID=1660089 RepID=UPI00086AEBA6|nr:asparagine synthase (glutamine-hydrolyzing) [Arenimonas sp. SCN 70-307]ODS63089.1 MAG: asparagine synthase (glutamine-hydrolyzing) [Arenimonas sp. SCN 70-307]
MCGIAGVLGPGSTSPDTLVAMARALAHRGPDGQGIWQDAGAGVAFVHRRLAILDLSEAGSQPMLDREGRWAISFNGEIYNHQSLRKALGGHSQAWRGTSDTEVLLRAIADWGVESALVRCEGMFALAAWDRINGELFLARDKTGERPLYVGWLGGDIVFGSELKALRCHPSWRGGMVEKAVHSLLRWGFIPSPLSIHPAVYKIPPGTLLRLKLGDAGSAWDLVTFQCRLKNYWSLASIVDEAARSPWEGGLDEAAGEAQRLLDASVRSRMNADVPVGALLSGGIDSSLVVESMQRQASGRVQTFCVGFDEAGLDESEVSQRVARLLGTEHHILRLPSHAAMDLVPSMAEIYDEPFADMAQLPAVLVGRAIREHVTVALTGDGGDELFGGYQRYLDCEDAWRIASALPTPVVRCLEGLLRAVGRMVSPGLGRLPQRANRLVDRLREKEFGAFYEAWLAFPGSGRVLSSPCRSTLASHVREWPRKSLTPGESMRYLDQSTVLADGIHTKLDRSSMASGLELRVPLLDSAILSFSWGLADELVRRDGAGKPVLRRMLSRHLPPEVSERRKHGFDVPVSAWLRGGLRSWAEELISGAGDIPGLDKAGLRRLYDDHLSGRLDAGHALWAALMVIAWRQHND